MFDFAEKPLAEIPIVVLDTETTGLYPGLGHRVVEIGAVRFEPADSKAWQVVAQMNQLLNPGRTMDPRAARVSGIRDEDLAGAPAFQEISGDLLALVDGALLVAHNARFDADFLGIEFFIEGLAAGRTDAVLLNPWLCTLELARRHFHFGYNNLGHIARNLGVRLGRAHRALNDVYMTAEVLKRMARLLAAQRLETVGDLLYAQGGAIYAPPPPRFHLPPPLDEAVSTGRSLRILYLGETGETERVITPRYPAEHEGVPYLIAYCHLRQDLRTFRLDRIFRAELV